MSKAGYERRVEVGVLNEELGDVKGAIEIGRRMLELDDRLTGLETRLAVKSLGQDEDEDGDDGWDVDFDNDDDDKEEENDAQFVGSSPSKLAALAREYVRVDHLAGSLGRELPSLRHPDIDPYVRHRRTHSPNHTCRIPYFFHSPSSTHFQISTLVCR